LLQQWQHFVVRSVVFNDLKRLILVILKLHLTIHEELVDLLFKIEAQI
jgi:hypothetical protein